MNPAIGCQPGDVICICEHEPNDLRCPHTVPVLDSAVSLALLGALIIVAVIVRFHKP